MSGEKMQRTTYRDPTQSSSPLRLEDPVDRAIEAARDIPAAGARARLKPSRMGHRSGTGSDGHAQHIGAQRPAGVAIDNAGRHISLALNGEAEIGPTAGSPGAVPNLVGVLSSGAVMPTTGLSGTLFLTIQFFEWFQGYINGATDPNEFYKYVHTPWLRLQTAAPIDGSLILLAKVILDTNGNVTSLTRDAGTGTFLPAESVHLSKAVNRTSPNLSVDTGLSGQISSHPAGGIQVKGQDTNDVVRFVRSDGSDSVSINPGSGLLNVGATGVGGTINVIDGVAVTTIQLEAATGAARLKRVAAIDPQSSVVDIDASNVHIHGGLQVDGDFSALMGDPVRRVVCEALYSDAGDGGVPVTLDIDLGTPRLFTAFVGLVTLDNLYDNEAVFVDICRVDGNDTPLWLSGGNTGDVRYPFCFGGTGRIITFRLCTIGLGIACSGVCVVFYE